MKQRNQCRRRWISARSCLPANYIRRYCRCLCCLVFAGLFLFGYITPVAAQFTFDQYDVSIGSKQRQTILTGFLFGDAVADIAVVNLDENNARRLRIYAFGNNTWNLQLNTTLRPDVSFIDIANIGGRDRLITYERGRLNWFEPVSATEQELAAVTSRDNAFPIGQRTTAGDHTDRPLSKIGDLFSD